MAHFSVSLTSSESIPTAARTKLNEMAALVAAEFGLEVEEEVVEPSFKVTIQQDMHPVNPRTDCDNAGVMFCKHSRYNLGDKDAHDPFVEQTFRIVQGQKITNRAYNDDDLPDGIDRRTVDDDWGVAEQNFENVLRNDIALCWPIYMYEHSGITISHGDFGDRWDSGQVGWHYITKEKLESDFNGDVEAAKHCLEGELETYDHYLRGNVWIVDVEDEEGETIESCGGFIGDDIEACGIIGNFDAKYNDALREAWERRFG